MAHTNESRLSVQNRHCRRVIVGDRAVEREKQKDGRCVFMDSVDNIFGINNISFYDIN